MHELAPLIFDLALMLGIASVVIWLFQRIHQPVVLGYLVAGIIIGPHTPPHALVSDISNIKILSELGVIFLMFSLGLKFSFHKLAQVGCSALITGIIEVILMICMGYSAGRLLHWSNHDSLFLGAALSISSTTIIIKAIDELGLKTKRFAELIFGILIAEDLLAILLLVALSTIVVTQNVFSLDMLMAIGQLILVVGGWFIFGYFLVPSMFRSMGAHLSQEMLTIISVALCLLLVSIAAYFHYSTALGAFIMGSILVETSLVNRIEELITPIRDIFGAVFFISVGMLIDPVTIIEQWPTVLFISLVTLVGKLITTSLGALLTGQSLNTSVRVGFAMAQVGEFSFIIATLGLVLNVTSHMLYPIIVAVSGITTFATPYLIRFSSHASHLLDGKLPERVKHFLRNYSAWVYRTQTTSERRSLLRIAITRLFINSIIIVIIFMVVKHVVLPELASLLPIKWVVETLCLVVALMLSSPFIWGMLFALRNVHLSDDTDYQLGPEVSLIWLVTLMEITFLSVAYFQTWVVSMILAILFFVYFIFSYRHLERSYYWLERQLLNNLKKGKDRSIAKYTELAPWDTHLVEMEVGNHSRFVGKRLARCQLREKYGVNVVAICRGPNVIAPPRSEEKIFAHDKLIVLGNDEQLDLLKIQIEKTAKMQEGEDILDHFKLKAILLENHHPLVGQTIRGSRLQELINGMIVGLERNNVRIVNPPLDTVLLEGDLLLVVGEWKRIELL
jgi:monovalent cation:H+ antiporter-2, CPA2 family